MSRRAIQSSYGAIDAQSDGPTRVIRGGEGEEGVSGSSQNRTLVTVASLSPAIIEWTILVRVTIKLPARPWNNSNGEGRVMNVHLVDKTGEIKAVAFNEIADKMQDALKQGKVYYVSKGKVKPADKKFSSVQNDYELCLNECTKVELCTEGGSDLPTMQYNFTKIAEIENTEPNTVIDVIGVCRSVDKVTRVTVKATKKQIPKRDIQLVDESGKVVTLTLWHAEAESFDGSSFPVIALKSCKVSDYGGRSLSTQLCSVMNVDPGIPEASKLLAWFNNKGKNIEVSSISDQQSRRGEEQEQKLLEEAMKEGRVDAGEGLLIFLGVTGSGKTEFQRIVLGKKVPKYSPSTPLATRPVSIYNTKVDGVDWMEMGPKEMLEIVAEKINQRRQQTVNPISDAPKPSDLSSERESCLPAPNGSIREGEGGDDGECELTDESMQVGEHDSSVGLSQEFNDALQQLDLKLIQAIRESSRGDVEPQLLMDFDFIYLLDSGGQPAFREMLPHFVQQASAIVLMQKLNERLDYKPTIRYREEGGKVDKGYTSQLTNEQILHQYIQAIQSHKSKVFVIGTHRDKEGECEEETREDKNKKLREAFRGVLEEQLMLYDMKELMFSLNCKSRRKDDKEVARQFKERVMNEFKRQPKKQIPLLWFIFKQLLQLLAEEMNVSVLSVKECCKAAQQKLHMSEDRCQAALNHLGRLNIIFYRPEILPGVVFYNVQVILDKITELVHCNHALRSKENVTMIQIHGTNGSQQNDEDVDDGETPSRDFSNGHNGETNEPHDTNESQQISENSEVKEKYSQDSNVLSEAELEMKSDPVPCAMKSDRGLKFRDFGRVYSELLEETFPSHYREGLFTAPHLLHLLERMLIAGRLNNGKHFIPSLLPDLSVEQIAKYRATADHPPPLVIYYPKMWLPVGVIPSLVVYLQNQCGWEPAEEKGKPTCMMHNCIEFVLPDGESGSIVLIDSVKFLEIHVKPMEKLDPATLQSILHGIRDNVVNGLQEAHTSLHYNSPETEFGFLCPGLCGNKDLHYVTLVARNKRFKFSENTTIGGKLNESQKLWLQEDADHGSYSTGSETLTQNVDGLIGETEQNKKETSLGTEDLHDVRKVVLSVTDRWKHIGVALRLDLGQLKKIKKENSDDLDDCLTEMLSLWLNKNYNTERFGEPSWELLARAVGDRAGGNDSALAEKIRKEHGCLAGDDESVLAGGNYSKGFPRHNSMNLGERPTYKAKKRPAPESCSTPLKRRKSDIS